MEGVGSVWEGGIDNLYVWKWVNVNEGGVDGSPCWFVDKGGVGSVWERVKDIRNI